MRHGEKGYNGWTNRSTWCVKLWMDNEESSYRYWKEQARYAWEHAEADTTFTSREHAIYNLSESLRGEFEEAMPELEGVWQDLLTWALGDTDWREIATSLLSEHDDEQEGDDA